MRKLVCLLAVAIFAAPAFGGNITFTAYEGEDSQFLIGYSTDDPCALSGLALWVELSGSCSGTVTGKANVLHASAEFDVHIDYASDDPCNYTIGEAQQHPLAEPCQAGTPAGPLSYFSICMGRLDPCNPPPADEPCLVVIEVDFVGECTLTVDIEPDNKRGGAPGNAVTANDGTVTHGAGPNVPPCWLYDGQCHGDYNDDGSVSTGDWPTFRDGFGYAYPHVKYLDNRCGDNDQDGEIDTADWPDFRDYFGKPTVYGCQALGHIPGAWPP